MAGLWVHHRDDPIRRGAANDAPLAGLIAGFDVLTCHERQQAQRVVARGVEVSPLDTLQEPQRVVDQPAHQGVLGFRIVPGALRLADLVVIVGDELDRSTRGHHSANPTDRPDQLGDRVLGRDGIVEHRRVQRPARPALEHPGLGDHLPHRIEDPLRTLRAPQPRPPIRQHRRMKPLVRHRQARGGLPRQIPPQRLRRLSIRKTLQGLEHHHRCHHIGRHRRSAPPRRKQILKQRVREQLMATISQEREQRTLRHQMPTQTRRVQELGVRIARTLHTPSLKNPPPNREHQPANFSAGS